MSDEVICLSDSDESFRSAETDKLADFTFPAVEFTYRVNESINGDDDDDVPKSTEQPKRWAVDEKKSKDRSPTHSDPRTRPKKIDPPKSQSAVVEKPKDKESDDPRTRSKKTTAPSWLKAAERQNLKRIQPGECTKYVRVCLDRNLERFDFYLGAVEKLVRADLRWRFDDLPVANSVVWTREVEEHYADASDKRCTKKTVETEKQMIIIWDRDETVAKVKEGSFLPAIKNATKMAPGARLALIIYGMGEYFSGRNKKRDQSSKRRSKDRKISMESLEICLAEIELVLRCSGQLVDDPEELGFVLCRFTKSVAEIPYKREKKRRLEEKLDWYATGDNRDTVRVDKNGNGLKRLWQQQLCQFNLASLETAESISMVYPSPLRLMEAYRNCTCEEGEQLLKDIPIRRAAGPLSTVRKIGPELSKKIFIMFTSNDGEATLGNDKEP